MAGKTRYLLPIFIFILSVIAITLPSASYVYGLNNSFFNVTLNITAQQGINITDVSGSSGTPTLDSTTAVYVIVNVTDSEGDLVAASSHVNITYPGGATHQSSSCTKSGPITGITYQLNCTVDMDYFDVPGSWNISAYVEDADAFSDVEYNYSLFSYSELCGMQIQKTVINFTTAVWGGTIDAADDPLPVENIGNCNYANINMTAYSLTNGTKFIGSGNFTVNVTNATGTTLGSEVNIPGSALNRGSGSVVNLYLWMTIPSVPAGYYYGSSLWEVEAIK